MKNPVGRRIGRLLFVFAFFCSVLRAEEVPDRGLKAGDLVAICGDSITEAQLYSVYLESYLLMCQPAPRLQAMQFGWSGQASWTFLPRIDNDVLPFAPSVATLCYGMNDAGYVPTVQRKLDLYRKAMGDVVRTLQRGGVRFVIVGSSGAVDTDTFKRLLPFEGVNAGNQPQWLPAGEYNQALARQAVIAKEVAEENGAVFADIHGLMLEVMAKAKQKYGKAYHVAGPDGIHPAANGHLIMAYAFLKAMGCSGDIGTITWDWATQKALGSEGHRIVKADRQQIEVESKKYPFCFFGDPAVPDSTSGIIEFFPFNQDLNRFRLVVTNSPSQGLAITWGKATRKFSAAELANGINLASEFLDNPFRAPFLSVEAAIKKQQAFEMPAVKTLLNPLKEWRRQFPEGGPDYQRLVEKVLQRDRALREVASRAVVPVRHTILMQPI